MNMHATRDGLLGRVLLAPEEAHRRKPASSFAAGPLLRFGFTVAEIVQIEVVGVAAASLAAAPVEAAQALYVALMAAVVAVVIRPRLALASTAIAIGAVGLCAALLSPAPTLLLPWLVAWAAGSTAVSMVLDRLAARLPGQFNPAALRVAMVGEPDHIAVGRQTLSPDWHVVRRVRDDLPEEMDELRTLALSGSLHAIVLALPIQEPARIAAAQALLCDIPVRICLALDTTGFEAAAALGGTRLVDLAPEPQASIAGAAKRALDLILAGSALLVLLPVLCLIGLAIRQESPGNALFRQWRFGVGSRPISVFKFRTMRCDLADPTGEQRTTSRDPRVTRLGRLLRRTSIDELPQLINVIRGEMSLVGPRPHPLHMKVEGVFYFDAVAGYRVRHRVLPGITGWAQINGSRGEVDTLEKAHRRVELDLWYINNWSLGLDLKIILRTLLGGFASLKAD